MVQCMQQVSFCGGKQDDTLMKKSALTTGGLTCVFAMNSSVKSRKRQNRLEKIHILFTNKLTPERTLAA